MCLDSVIIPTVAKAASLSTGADPDLRRFDALWWSHARRGHLPAMDHIDPMAVADLIDRLVLVDLVRSGGHAEFRPVVVGEDLALDGDPLSDDACRSLHAAAATGEPSRWGRHVAYPLASNGRDVDSLICVRAAP